MVQKNLVAEMQEDTKHQLIQTLVVGITAEVQMATMDSLMCRAISLADRIVELEQRGLKDLAGHYREALQKLSLTSTLAGPMQEAFESLHLEAQSMEARDSANPLPGLEGNGQRTEEKKPRKPVKKSTRARKED